MVTAIAVSGGIDSLTAAYQLKHTGEEVIGLHFMTGYESTDVVVRTGSLYDTGTMRDPVLAPLDHPIGRIADQLDIPVYLVDCRNTFRQMVVDYFVNEYRAGRTPNPCMICNPHIKFGILFEVARKLGATSMATGHYARVERVGGRFRLLKGLDPGKDQSYFLAMLTQKQLANACFPLGATTKNHVRQIAEQSGLTPSVQDESQDICFIRNQSYTTFLEAHGLLNPSPGPIVDIDEKPIGRHDGLHRYTIGQRRGIGCPASEPYYVVRIDAEENRLVVGFKDALYARQCFIIGVNWISAKPDAPIPVQTKIRYRHRAAASVLVPLTNDTALIRFDRSEPAVTPGQAAVCYQEDRVIAGGWIEPLSSEKNETEN